jgi:AraC-like DNA-binding protein/quercetin dioxygenase-like cupin family protein
MIPKYVYLPTIEDFSEKKSKKCEGKYILLRKDNLDIEEKFAINRYEEKIKKETKFHYHDFVEITYIASGSGFHVVNDKEYEVIKGDLFIINYDMWHGFYKKDIQTPLIVYNLLFTPDFLDDNLVDVIDYSSFPKAFLLKGMDPQNCSKADLHVQPNYQVKFEDLISKIYMEYTLKPAGYLNMIRAHMIELIVTIVRRMSKENAETNSAEASIIEEAIDYLHKNYLGNISLKEVARKAFFSKNYFCKIFKQYTGMCVYELVHKLRIESACEMLVKQQDKRIVDIAMEVGYSDYKAFSQNFKKIMGMKPHEYKNLNQN